MSLYGLDVVEAHWPVDGPRTAERIESAAVALAELVRYLNHATMPQGGALTEAPHGAGVLGSLATAAHREVQLCRQLASWARRVAADPTVRHDRERGDAERSRQLAATSATEAAAELRFAVDIAEELGSYLDRARSRVDCLSHPEGGGDLA